MKNKLSRIVGVAVSLALVASLCVFAIPAATPAEAAPGKQQWSAQTLPTATSNVLRTGSNVTDFAVGHDGLTIYVANNGVLANAAGAVLISTDGGQSFTALTVGAAAADKVSAIAVASDDTSKVAVVADSGPDDVTSVVWISSNSGKTWSSLPTAYDTIAGHITDIDVGPAREGCVFGREYVVSMADPAAGVTLGDVQIIGRLATWATTDTVNVRAQYDYMAVQFTPGFVGDRVIAAVGATAVAGNVSFQLINDNTKTEVRVPVIMSLAAVGLTTIDYYGTLVTATAIKSADIALPNDFDPTVTAMRSSFAAFGAQTTFTDNDVYRIDNGTIRDLDAVTALAVKSIAYTGIIDDGTLFVGEYAENNVKYAADPWVSIPSWKSTKKAPSPTLAIGGMNPQTIVRMSPVDSNVIFAGTSSTVDCESAFSVSTNAAVSFDAESLIDHDATDTVVTVDDIYLTPEAGTTIFMATTDTGTAHVSLWKSELPTSSTSWSRIYYAAFTGAGLIRLNPDWADTPVIYFAQRSAAGAIYVSTNGGDTFSIRAAPTGITATDLAVENSTILYLGDVASQNLYKSTNSAWTWGTPVSTKAGVLRTLAMAPSYPNLPVEGNLLAGGTTGASYSTDGATSFTRIAGGLAATGLLQIMAHEDYADNNTIYCADTGAAGSLNAFRFVIGTSTSWENLVVGGLADLVGLGMVNGVLYIAQEIPAATTATAVIRTLYPTAAVGVIPWEACDAGVTQAGNQDFLIAPSALRVAAGSSELYAVDTANAPSVLAYSDLLATDVTSLAAPADGATVNVDPVSGRADDIQFAWSSMGSGTGLVDCYQIQICVAGTGFAAPLTLIYEATAAATIAGSTGGLDATNPQLVVGATGQWVQALMANTDYDWRIRARGQISADAVRSGWSAVRSFSIQAGGVVQQTHEGPIMLGPVGGAVDVTLSPGFSWAPIARSTEYEFILATDAGLVNTIAGTPASVTDPAFQVTAPLEYGTVYFWAVKSTKPTVSPQSIGSFTTMAEPAAEVWTCMQCGLTFASEAALEAHITAEHAPVTPATPAYIWAIIAIGAVLVIVVIVLITRTRRIA